MLECVINISEGRDPGVLERLDRSAGASLRDRHSDPFHHRSVFTLINAADPLARDVRRLVDDALSLLDLAGHDGVHPRLGVVDVVPFVPLSPDVMATAVRLRDETAAWLATTYGVPVFLYGPLAAGERTLPDVRAHAFVDLAPDWGAATADARRGAAVIGAREVLVAWNLWLGDVSLEEARSLARLVRRPGVRALGLQVGDRVQVSCNLVDVSSVKPSEVFDQVGRNLVHGRVERAEVVGLVPQSLLEREDPGRWAELGLSQDATIESRLRRA